jgi:LacI family transcriptional regulator
VLKMIQSRTTRAEDHVGAVNLVVRESCGPDLNISRDRVA